MGEISLSMSVSPDGTAAGFFHPYATLVRLRVTTSTGEPGARR